MRPLSLALALILFCTATAAQQTAQSSVTLKVGVRPDAISMAYRATGGTSGGDALTGPLADAGYRGYMAYICDRALIELRLYYGRALQVEVVEVTALEIFEALETNRIDIMCGPTTATRDRLQGRISSSPLFLSGVTFASRLPGNNAPCQAVVGYLGGSTAGNRNLSRIAASGELSPADVALLAATPQSDIWQQNYGDCAEPVEAELKLPTHAELAAAFCSNKIRHYVGDLEIITRSLQAQAALSPEGACDYVLSPTTFSEERYVILGNAGSQGDSIHPTVAHFFEVLSRQVFFQPSVLDDAFNATFPMAQPSRKLDLLFWAMRGNSPAN